MTTDNTLKLKTDEDEGIVCLKTPRLLCTLILSSPPPNVPNLSGNPSYFISNIVPSKHELSFLGLKPSKVGRNFGSHDTSASVRSTSSRHSTNTAASNISASVDVAASSSLKRTGSFSSVTSSNSITGPAQAHLQDKNTYRPSAAFGLPVNPVMGTTRMKIVFGEYLLVPTSDARILVYQVVDFLRAQEYMQELEFNNSSTVERNESFYKTIGYHRKLASNIQQEKESVQPILALGPFNMGDYNTSPMKNTIQKSKPIPATIVDICACDCEMTAQNSNQGSVAILTQDGGVHVMEFSPLQTTSRGDDDEYSQLKVEHIHSFHAGDICAMAISMQRSLKRTTVTVNNSNSVIRQYKTQLNISVGFEGGYVAEFAVVDRQHKLKWKGSVGAPILSLAYIYCENDGRVEMRGENRSPTRRESLIPLEPQLHLLIGSMQNDATPYERNATSSMADIISSCLDIVNIEQAETEWRTQSKKGNGENTGFCMDITEITIWPDNSLVGSDPWKVSLTGKRIHDRHGSSFINSVCCIETSSKGHNCFSAVLGSGAVVTFHYRIEESRGFCWGLAHKNNHVMIPNASCCGLGIIQTGDVSNKETIVACCLRAGTTVLLPTSTTSKMRKTKHLTVYSSAFDATGIDDDGIRYVQGFAAGNICIRTWGRTSLLGDREKVPIFVQAWANGYIDCFICDVDYIDEPNVGSMKDRRTYLFRRLLSNGTIGALCCLLSLDHSEEEGDSLLKKASAEYKLLNCTEEELLSKINGNSKEVKVIRQLLLNLVSGNECDIL